jgi:fibronectin type 3 domain-containing protein
VTPGRKYSYRVTAVSTAGKESAPSAEVTETAAQ